MITEVQKLLIFENDLIARHGFYSANGKQVTIAPFVENAKRGVEPLALDAALPAPTAGKPASIVITRDAALDVAMSPRFGMNFPVCILFTRTHAHASAMLRTALNLVAPDAPGDKAAVYAPGVTVFRTARLEKMAQPLWVSLIVAAPTAAADIGGLLRAAAAKGHREVVIGVSQKGVYQFDEAILALTMGGPLAGVFSHIVLSAAEL
jgi:hypothetical protein